MNDNIIYEKSVEFSIRIVKLYKYLSEDKKEFVLSKQILRSGTSIGANISEANYAQSRSDFVSKLQIALKETAETEYWLNVFCKSDYINEKMFNSLIDNCLEIKKLLVSSINTSKAKL